MDISKDIEKVIICFYPVYKGGDNTEVVFKDGSQSIKYANVRIYLKDLAYYYNTDLKSLSKHTAEELGQKYSNPLPIGGQVWVPYYVRKSKIKRDTCTGYFALSYIKGLHRIGNKVLLEMRPGLSIKINNRPSTANKRLNNARLLEKLIKNGERSEYIKAFLENVLFLLKK
jgi:hypothetical protein